jgi:hypothetical protein
MKFENGEIVKTGGLLPNTVFDSDEVKAIRMVIRDEIQKMNDEAEKIDEQAYRDGFDQFNGI